jgi:hypothetical protein
VLGRLRQWARALSFFFAWCWLITSVNKLMGNKFRKYKILAKRSGLLLRTQGMPGERGKASHEGCR